MSSRTDPTRVALLAPTLAPAGGLCRWSRELVRSLELVADQTRVHVDVLVRNRLDVARATVEQFGLRCTLHDLAPTGKSTPDRLRAIRHTGRLVGELAPDVVHIPLDWLWVLGSPRLAPTPIVATAHSEPRPAGTRSVVRRLARSMHRRGMLTLAAGAPSLRSRLDAMVGVRSGTAVCLPVATDLTRSDDHAELDVRDALGIHPDETVALTLCRLVSGKRVDLVLDVAELARRDDRAVRFVVCGDGPELRPLAAEAERRRLHGWIHFLGHVPDPSRVLAHADVVLHPSESEGGRPFALIEALLTGLPVVAGAAGGVRDLLADPRDGQLTPVGDAAAMYRALLHAPDGKADRDQRAGRARTRYDLRSMGAAHLDLVEQLAARHRRLRATRPGA